jgi:hypothetical protein
MGDKSRFEVQLEIKHFYLVQVVGAWSSTLLAVQFLGAQVHEIDEIIETATCSYSKPLAPNNFTCVAYNGSR